MRQADRISFFVAILMASSIFQGQFISAHAVSTVTKTITVKDSTNHVYSGASVLATYYSDGDSTETFAPVQTTNTSGQATISYPSDAAFLGISVEPPASDLTNAAAYVDALASPDSASANITLKPANLRLKVQTPSGRDGAIATCLNIPRSPTSKWDGSLIRLARTGVFGINLPSSLLVNKDYRIGVSPCNPIDMNYIGKDYGVRKEASGAISVYLNLKYQTKMTASSNTYTFTFDTTPISGQLVDASNQLLSLTGNTFFDTIMVPINESGLIDPFRNMGWTAGQDRTGAFSINPSGQPGRYEVWIGCQGDINFPSFKGGEIWADGFGKYATTETGTYASKISVTYVVPSASLIQFKTRDSGNTVISQSYMQVMKKNTQGSYSYLFTAGPNSSGIASMKLPVGIYQIRYNKAYADDNQHREYILTVTNSTTTLKDDTDQTITASGGYFDLTPKAPNVKFKVVDPNDHTTGIKYVSLMINRNFDGSGGWVSEIWMDTSTAVGSAKIPDGQYQVVVNPAGKFSSQFIQNTYTLEVVSGSPTLKLGTNTISASAGIFTVEAGLPRLKGRVQNIDKASYVRWSRVVVTSQADSKYRVQGSTDATGSFAIDLGSTVPDGTYYVQAIAPANTDYPQGNSAKQTITVTGGAGPQNIVLTLQKSNVTGTVKGPTGPSLNNWLSVTKNDGSGNYNSVDVDGPMTNEDGFYSLYLDPGTYKIHANGDFQNAGGTEADSANCVVGPDTTTAVICDINMVAPNVTGKITIDGAAPANVSIGFFTSGDVATLKAQGKGISQTWSGYTEGNTYGVTTSPGTYRMWIYYENYLGDHVAVPGPTCVVPDSGSKVCDASLPATNFSFSVKDITGTKIVQGASAAIQIKDGANYFWTCCTDNNTETLDGIQNVSLIDGSYQIQVQNNTGDKSKGVTNDYNFDITAGVISNFVIVGTTTAITPTAGIYNLSLKEPVALGVVRGYDAGGGIPNVRIKVSGGAVSAKGGLSWLYTDQNGRFAFEDSAQYTDGTYDLKAYPWDNNYGSSATVRIQVISGKVAGLVTLILNKPNLVGTVRGPTAVSASSSISIEKKDAASNWNSVDEYKATNQDGTFGFYLDPGTYRIHADGDYASTGGTSTYSQDCIIGSDTSTVVTCNVSLPAPNLTGKITLNGANSDNIFVSLIPLNTKNNKATESIWWINSPGGYFGTTAPAGNYRLQIHTVTTNGNWAYTPGALCTVPDTGTVICNTTLPKATSSIKFKNANDGTLSDVVFYELAIIESDSSTTTTCCTPVDSKFEMSLVDGSYKLRVWPNVGSDGGQQTYTFTVTSGVVSNMRSVDSSTVISAVLGIYTLKLKSPNVSGTISGPKGISARNSFYVQKWNSEKSYWDWIGISGQSDADGKFSVSLGQGTYRIHANSDIPRAGGAEAFSSNCIIDTDTVKAVTCNITLIAPTISGTLKIAGVLQTGINYILLPASGIDGNTARDSYGWFWSEDGSYGITAKPGTYRLSLGLQTDNNWTPTPGPICTVPVSGSVSCDANLPAPNVQIKLKTSANGNLSTNANMQIGVRDGGSYTTICCATVRSSVLGRLGLSLSDGKYQIAVWSNDARVDGTSQTYSIKVESGTVTSFTLEGSTSEISATAGIYTISFKPPTLSGTVLNTAGISGVENAEVRIRSEKFGIGASTNTSGIFTADFGNNGVDGIYSLQAFPRLSNPATGIYDSTTANSKIETATVSSGAGPQNIQLKLRKPTLKGTISGPLGVLPGGSVQLQKQDSSGGWQWTDLYTQTDSLGKFYFYVDTGTYRVFSNGDFNVTGGVQTYSNSCNAYGDTTTAVTCNLTLLAPNVTGVAKIAGTNLPRGYVYLEPDWRVQSNTANGWYNAPVTNGRFGINAGAGTYTPSLYTYQNGNNTKTPGAPCVAPASGSVECNFNLPATNLTFTTKDSSGTLLTDGIYTSLELKNGTSWSWSCCSYPDNMNRDGKFYNNLVDGSYRLTLRPYGSTLGTSKTYLFSVETGTVTGMRAESGGANLSPTGGVYSLQLKTPTLSGTVYAKDGVTPLSNVRINTTFQGSSWCCSYSNSAGKFVVDYGKDIPDGVWDIQAVGNETDLTTASSAIESVTVSSGVGSNSIRLVMRSPNVSGVVSGVKGISPSNWVRIRQILEGNQIKYLDNQFLTDSLGRYAFYLAPGRYQFTAQSDMQFAGGTEGVSENCDVTANANFTCNIALPAPNLSGSLTIGGTPTQGSIEFIKVGITGYEWSGLYTGTDKDGKYYINAPAGKYRPRINLWQSGQQVVGPLCTVSSPGSTTCNFALPAPNFVFRVIGSDNSALKSDVWSSVTAKLSDLSGSVEKAYGGLGFCCNTIRDITDPRIKVSLFDGNYQISVWTNDQKKGTNQTFDVTIETGTVKSAKKVGSNTNLTADGNGTYSLALGVPAIAGTVVAPDGTTPVPGAVIDLYTNPSWSYWSNISDDSGYFAYSQLADGTYKVIASPAWGDSTKAASDPISVTVTGGMGSSTLKPQLRTPNVIGVVRGVKGVSPRNWINARRVVASGGWQYVDYQRSVMTSSEGNYSFYLPAGTYQFQTNGDQDIAGGSATVSDNCVVPDSGVATCNIYLPAPNMTVRVVAPGQTTWSKDSWVYANLMSWAKDSTPKSWSHNFEWNKSGDMQTTLEDGTWQVRAFAGGSTNLSDSSFYVTVSGGIITAVKDDGNQSVVPTNGTYLLALKSAVITGTITFNGVAYIGGASVTLQQLNGDNFWSIQGKWASGSTFGFDARPGTYRIEVTPYNYGMSTTAARTRSATCVVLDQTPITCNVALKAPNLLGKITTDLGDTYRYSYAYLYQVNTSGESWDSSLNVYDGQFSTYLPDGNYRVWVNPWWDQRSTYTEKSYKIVVTSETITSITTEASGETLTPTSGIYSFKLGTTSMQGTVYAPGSSTQTMANIQVVVGVPGGLGKWRYSTSTDASGKFGLNIPNGTYVVWAMPYGGGFQYGKSETQTVVVSGGGIALPLVIHLRDPNLQGVIVTPGSNPLPLANVNVNINIDGESFYGWTDSDGRFAAFVSNPSPNCPSRCQIYLNYYANSDYTPKTYNVSSIGNLGNLPIGGVTSRVTVLVPQIGSPIANKYGWISAESYDSATSNWLYVTGVKLDAQGVGGLSLDEGKKYRIIAYPGADFSGTYAPKTLQIDSFTVAANATPSITFDSPNISLTVLSATASQLSYGWFTVSKLNAGTGIYDPFQSNSLDAKGKGGLTLANGTYQLNIWPGKSAGVQKQIGIVVNNETITVTGSVGGLDTIVGGNISLKLANGNISGTVVASDNSLISNAIVAAVRTDDATKFVTTTTNENGYFELNLDLTYSWTVKATDPTTSTNGNISVASRSPSNTVVANQKITLV